MFVTHILFDRDYAAAGAIHGDELRHLLQILVEQDLVETRGPFLTGADGFFKLTFGGLAKVEELSRSRPQSTLAFVAMSFSPELDDAYKRGIKPALKDSGFLGRRMDEIDHDEIIDNRMLNEIKRSGLLVADFTFKNNGAYFEAGFAMGLNIHVIRTCRRDYKDHLHFDVDHYNFIFWETPDELRQKLIDRIGADVNE